MFSLGGGSNHKTHTHTHHRPTHTSHLPLPTHIHTPLTFCHSDSANWWMSQRVSVPVCDLPLWQLCMGVEGSRDTVEGHTHYSTSSTTTHTLTLHYTHILSSHSHIPLASHPHTLHLPYTTLKPSPGVSSYFPATSPSAYIFVTLVFW